MSARRVAAPLRNRRVGDRPAGRRRRGARQPFIVLTGLSGSGKSQAIRALEDLGYFCVDNLPATLIPTLAKLSLRPGGIEKVAIVVDIRERNFLVTGAEDLRPAAQDAPSQLRPDLPRGRQRGAAAAVQRDAAAASDGAESIGQRRAFATSAKR